MKENGNTIKKHGLGKLTMISTHNNSLTSTYEGYFRKNLYHGTARYTTVGDRVYKWELEFGKLMKYQEDFGEENQEKGNIRI